MKVGSSLRMNGKDDKILLNRLTVGNMVLFLQYHRIIYMFMLRRNLETTLSYSWARKAKQEDCFVK